MNTLNIDFENCYGIKKLVHQFSFTGHHTQLVYAPNGMMKTSFAKTLKGLSGQEKKRAKDLLHADRAPKDDLLVDGNQIPKEQIFVADPEDKAFDSSGKFVNFLADANLKAQYDAIYQALEQYVSQVITPLRDVSQSADCDMELLRTFSTGPADNLFSIMERLANEVQANNYQNFGFRYNFVFDTDDKVKVFVEKHINDLRQYIDKYNELLENSNVFRSSGEHTFGTHQASQLQKTLEGGDFFGVDHKIQLHDGTVVTTSEQLNQLFDAEKTRILNNADLKKVFDRITKAADANGEVRNFKNVLIANPALIVELADFEEFRKKTWRGYLSDARVRQNLLDYNAFYQSQKAALQGIITQSRAQLPLWKEIIDLYKARFYVPFEVEIENQDDIILRQTAAKLKFSMIDDQNAKIEKGKEEMLFILSNGERRAFYILQLLFELESRKKSGMDHLIVFDDIADSFDYQNKYAIIEYLHDLDSNAGNIYLLVFTHNFDFYRTLASRLGLRQNSWMAIRNAAKEIELRPGEYQKDLFANFLGRPVTDNKIFVSMIPFVRNLVEYTAGQNADYLKLTSCLHLKTDTMNITEAEVIGIITSFTKAGGYARPATTNKVYDIIMNTASGIAHEVVPDEVAIENKIVLSIACRLLAERYMKRQLLTSGLTEADLATSNVQTAVWAKKMKMQCPNDPNKNVIEKVNMMTPEFIHINSFMYEPLIDLSIHHLVNLYNECAAL